MVVGRFRQHDLPSFSIKPTSHREGGPTSVQWPISAPTATSDHPGRNDERTSGQRQPWQHIARGPALHEPPFTTTAGHILGAQTHQPSPPPCERPIPHD